MLRIDSMHPEQSFLLGKLTQPPAGCGDRMPLVGMLTADELQCVRAWVIETARAPLPDAGQPDASTDAGEGVDASTDAGATDAGDGSVDVDAGDAAPDDASTEGGT